MKCWERLGGIKTSIGAVTSPTTRQIRRTYQALRVGVGVQECARAFTKVATKLGARIQYFEVLNSLTMKI
eukprot:scaffold8637_cov256-Chaetoceros_neogracile.AAC.5